MITISQRTDWRTDETDDFAVAIPRSAIKILNTDNWIQWSGTDSSPIGVVTRCCTACLAVTDSKECGGTARHWCSPTWSWHSGAETAPLVAWETENRFQIVGACFQVITWSCSTLHVGRLSTRHGRTWHVRRYLRSSDVYIMCVVPQTQSQIGDRSFSVAGPQLVRNNLLTEIRMRDITFEHYERLHKAFLFV